MNCLNCQIKTNNPKFCSKSCAASYNNKIYPKRSITRRCTRCNNLVHSTKSLLCKEHSVEYKYLKTEKYKNKTVGEYRNLLSVKGKHGSWLNAHIRNFARSWLKHLTKLPCKNCGYDKHVELCHIKPVSSFTDETLLKEINSENNVIQLCRNCHWEMDNLK